MSLWSFMYNLAEREVFGNEYSTVEEKIVDNSNLGIDYKKHRKTNNTQDWCTKANTTRQFINNLEPRLKYKLMRTFERSKPDLYSLLSNWDDKELLNYKDKIYGVINNVIGIPVQHLICCEDAITIPNRSGYVPSTPAQELIHVLVIMQIQYHKSLVWMNPNKYDEKGILNGHKFSKFDPELTGDDQLILGKLGIYHNCYGSSSFLEQKDIPKLFAASMNTDNGIDD